MYIDVQKVPKIRNGIESMNRIDQKKPETRSPPCPSPEAKASLQPGQAQALVDRFGIPLERADVRTDVRRARRRYRVLRRGAVVRGDGL